MIMNMNEKGRQTKLLAAIAIIAMVVCAFAVAMPSEVQGMEVTQIPDDGDGATIIKGADGTVTPLQQLQSALGNSAVTEIVIQTSIEIPEGTTVIIPEGKKVWINNASGNANTTNKVCLTIEGTLVVEGTLYNNAGTNKTTSGFYNSGIITYNGDGVLYSTSADGSTGTGQGVVNGFFSVIGTGANNYKHMYAASLNAVASKAIDAKYNDGTNGKAIYSYGTTSADTTTLNNTTVVVGGVNGATSTMNIPETVTLTIESTGGLLVKSNSTADNDGTITNKGATEFLGQYTGTGVLDNSDASEFAVSTYLWDEEQFVSTKYVSGQTVPEITLTHDGESVRIGSQGADIVVSTESGSMIGLTGGKITYKETTSNNETTTSIEADGTETLVLTDVTLNEEFVLGAETTYAAGNTMTFGTNGSLNIGEYRFNLGGDLFATNPAKTMIDGSSDSAIYTYSTNIAFVEQYTSLNVRSWIVDVDTAQEFIDAVESGSKDIIIGVKSGDSYTDVTDFVLGPRCDVDYLELNGVTVTVYGSITVGTSGSTGNPFTLVINESTITDGSITTESASMGTGKITVTNGSSMEINHSGLFINVNAQTGSTVTSVDNYSTADSIPGSVMVGYGSNYTLSGTVVSGQNVKVWGTLVVPENGTLTINEGAIVNTAGGAVINVLGSMTVAGEINISSGVNVNVDGTFTLANTNGNAQFKNSGKVTVDGTFVVSAPNTGRPANVLEAGTNFIVNGTLNMNGTLKGDVQDKGTVTINGSTNDKSGAKIYVYDGVTLQVTSVSGTLNVSDKDVAKDIYGDGNGNYKSNVAGNVSDGNMVTLKNVKGVVISVQIDSVVKDDKRYVYSDMYVSGTITLIDDSKKSGLEDVVLGADGSSIATVNKEKGQIYIDAATAIGKNLKVNIDSMQTVTVTSNGTVTITAEGSDFVNEGELTVDGTITIGPKSAGDHLNGTAVNAVRYQVTEQSTGDVTTTYTNFAAAMDVIDTVDTKTIYVLGNVKVLADDTVASGQIVQITGTLEVSKDVALTVDNGGKVTGGSAVITVKGTFTSANFLADISVRTITADVVVDNAPARTYTSLANALANAVEGDIIILNGDVVISENTAIPAGVTVKSDYNVNITENAVLSVAGTLDISAKGSLTNVQTDDYDNNTDRLGSVTVTGTVAAVGDAEPAVLSEVSGAHYSKSVGAIDTYYVSSLAIAAQNVDNNISATIKVIGTVTSDAVTFTAPEGFGVLTVSVQDYGTSSDDKRTVVSVSEMTLDGVKLSIASGTSFSGTVTAAANGATASIDLDRVGNIDIQSVGVEGADGVTDYLTINSASNEFTGTIDIVSGTVTVATVSSGTSLAGGVITAGGESARMTVASGATLSVRTGSSVNVGYYGSSVNYTAGLIIDGTMDVKGTLTINGIMDVNGTLDVSESVSTTGVFVKGILNVMGAMNVSEELGKEGNVLVENILTVGSKPTSLGADGVITGVIDLGADGYVKVYSGTVESIIDGASAAESTALYINGALYMTIYGNGTIIDIVKKDDIELSGLTTPPMTGNDMIKFYSDEECKSEINAVTNIGVYENVYTKFDSAYVYGTVSEGTGFTLFIDGVPVSGGYGAGEYPLTVGTHIVSYDMVLGYNGDAAQLTFNGQTIQSGATITITADMDTFNITVTGAVPADIGGGSDSSASGNDSLGLTDYLLIVLVILIVVMAIIVAIRLMRS